MKKIVFLCVFLSLFLEARTWNEIKQSGILKAGVRTSAQLVYRPTDINNPGLVYEMLRDFAAYHKLKLELEIVPSFGTYWQKDGVNLNKTKDIQTPDIYKKIDLAAEIFTVTKRRKELLNMTAYLDNVELFFATKENKIRKLEEFIGKSIITYESMIFSKILKQRLEEKNIPYIIQYVKPANGKLSIKKEKLNKKVVNIYLIPNGTKIDGTYSYQPVADKQVDLGINDGIAVILRIFGNTHYRMNLRPLFPAQNKKSQLAWASEYKNKELNKKIEEFFVYDKKTGNFSKRLKKYIGMDLEEYNKLINMIN